MELGVFIMPLHDQRRNYTEVLKQDREVVILADRLGMTEVWLGEHFSCSCEPIADPLQFFASLVHATKQIKFCTGVLNLPQHHPVRIAGLVAQFDHMSEGRFVMGVGPGGLVSDMELFETIDLNRPEMVAESVKIIHEIWSQDPPFDIKGKYWNVRIVDNIFPNLGFGKMLKPFQKPFPEIAISIMSPHSNTAQFAGANDWSMVSANFIPAASVASHWEMYVKGCEEAGVRPESSKWRVARSLLVTDSDDEAEAYLARDGTSYHWYYDYILEDMKAFNMQGILKPSKDTPEEDITIRNCMDWMIMGGSPKTVLDKLVAFVDEIGMPFGKLLMTQKDWDNPAMHKRSMELLATEVMPKFSQHCEAFGSA